MRRSIVFKANQELAEWGIGLLAHDLERSPNVPLKGSSIRTRHREGLDHGSSARACPYRLPGDC